MATKSGVKSLLPKMGLIPYVPKAFHLTKINHTKGALANFADNLIVLPNLRGPLRHVTFF